MDAIIQPLLSINLYLILFYGIYLVFLRKETHFKLNRFYLIATVLLSIAIPFISLPEAATETIQSTTLSDTAQDLFAVQLIPDSNTAQESPFWSILITVYLLGVVVFLLRFLMGLMSILTLIKNSPREKLQGYWLIKTAKAQKPFSFFNFLFWDNSSYLTTAEYQQIHEHELAHIKQWHSLDVVFLEIIHSFFLV